MAPTENNSRSAGQGDSVADGRVQGCGEFSFCRLLFLRKIDFGLDKIRIQVRTFFSLKSVGSFLPMAKLVGYGRMPYCD